MSQPVQGALLQNLPQQAAVPAGHAFLCREVLRALPSQGWKAQNRQVSERDLGPQATELAQGWARAAKGCGTRIPRSPALGPPWRLRQQQKVVGDHSTWKCRMMVQIRPRVSLGLPSAMSSFLMFTNFTCKRVVLSHTHRQLGTGWASEGWGQPHLAVSEVVQGNLHVLQLVEAHPPLFPGLGGGRLVSVHQAEVQSHPPSAPPRHPCN